MLFETKTEETKLRTDRNLTIARIEINEERTRAGYQTSTKTKEQKR